MTAGIAGMPARVGRGSRRKRTASARRAVTGGLHAHRSAIAAIAAMLGVVALAALAYAVSVLSAASGTADRVEPVAERLARLASEVHQFERAAAVLSWIVSSATMVAAGGAFFVLFIVPRSRRGGGAVLAEEANSGARRVISRAATIAIAATVVSLPVRAAIVSGRGVEALTRGDLSWFVVGTPFGVAAVLRITGLVLAAVVLGAREGGVRRPVAVVVGGVSIIGGIAVAGEAIRRVLWAASAGAILASYAVVGHAQASEPRWFLVPANLVHVGAVAIWFGGLVMLLLEMRNRWAGPASGSALVVSRFSTAASVAVAAVVVTGVALAWSQLPSPGAAVSSSYGVTLSVKAAFVAVVLAIGGYNRQVLVPAVVHDQDDEVAWRRLRTTVTVEAVVIVGAILLASAVMVSGGFAGVR